MELVQGYVEDDRHVGIDDLERWHDTHVITFLSEIECVTSVDQLLKVRRRFTSDTSTDFGSTICCSSLGTKMYFRECSLWRMCGQVGILDTLLNITILYNT